MIKKIRIFFILLLLSALFVSPAFADKTTTTLTDVLGREVTVQTPVDSMVVQGSGGGGPFFTLLALGGPDIVKKIVAMDSTLEDNRNDVWQEYVKAIPELEKIPKTGSHTADLNPETVISLKPDVVIVPKGDYTGAVELYNKFEEAGIPVVVTDYHAETLENHKKSIELIGQLIGEEAKAAKLYDYYKSQMDIVTSRLDNYSGKKPRVYVECASSSADELGNSYGDYMWGALIKKCKGDNIGEGSVETYGIMNKEYILKQDPEVIIYTGSYWPKAPQSFRLGFSATDETAKETLKPYISREGWESLSAIKNSRVYGINHGMSREIFDFAAFQFIAKSLYPELFADVDPEANLKDFYDTYMPVKLTGKWMINAGQIND
jgi:iron complex transport system substrate-binding protein